MRGYNEVLEVGPGWKWHNELTIRLPDGNDVHFHHGKSANIMTVGQKQGTHVQSYHTKYGISYWGNPSSLLWAMQVMFNRQRLTGFCLRQVFKDRPIILWIIINSQPKLLPMVLNKGGRINCVHEDTGQTNKKDHYKRFIIQPAEFINANNLAYAETT